jgi:quinol monooxygenase YgiN
MSVLIMQRVPGDIAQFESYMAANGDLVRELSEKAKAGGCLAHRFAVGDGEVLVVDEWENAKAFEAFISSPEIQQAMGEMGAQGEPQTSVGELKGFPGEF